MGDYPRTVCLLLTYIWGKPSFQDVFCEKRLPSVNKIVTQKISFIPFKLSDRSGLSCLYSRCQSSMELRKSVSCTNISTFEIHGNPRTFLETRKYPSLSLSPVVPRFYDFPLVSLYILPHNPFPSKTNVFLMIPCTNNNNLRHVNNNIRHESVPIFRGIPIFFPIQIYGQRDRCKSVEISKCIMRGGGGGGGGWIHQNLLANWLDPATPALFIGSRAQKSFWHEGICTRFTGNWFILAKLYLTGLVLGTWIFCDFFVSSHF